MRTIFSTLLLLCAFSSAHAEGNYDPFNSKNPQERANAASMRDAIQQGSWVQARTFATTPSLQRLYQQAKREYSSEEPVPRAEVGGKDRIESHGVPGRPGR